MSLENLHCPQFVDFTVPESFDINDGADFFFEKGVVGEFGAQLEMDLGTFGGQDEDPVQQLTEKISNLNKKSLTPVKPEALNRPLKIAPLQAKNENQNPNRPVTRKSLKDAQATINSENSDDKENITQVKSVKDVASNKLDSAISSAIEMIMATTPVPCGTPPRPESFGKVDSTPVINDTTVTPEPPMCETKTNTSALTKPTAASLNKQKQPVLNGCAATTVNPNIVKKTLAKMTAAFKPNRPIVVDRDALNTKRTNFSSKKPTSVNATETRPSKAATPKQNNTSQDFKKYNESGSNELRLSRPMSPEVSGSRRCSSVPRTLKERQALNSSGVVIKAAKTNTLGEKIQNFFNSNNKSKQSQKNMANIKTTNSKHGIVSDPKDRRRSRSVNESIQTSHKTSTTSSTPSRTISSSARSRRPSSQNNESISKPNTTKSSYTKITASPSFSKPRQKSAERTLQASLPEGVTSFYTGVKFVSNNHNQLNIKKKLIGEQALPAFGASNTILTTHLSSLPVNELLKNRPMCLGPKPKIGMNTSVTKPPPHYMRTTPGKSASFRGTSATNTSVNKPHPKSNVSDQALNVSTDKTGRVRKVSESNTSMNGGAATGPLRTELRALKRSEYEQGLKEKEKMAAIIKHELDQEKLRKQQEEIQKIRMQRNFRSNPIKHYKPVTLKPSDKSLTEPKSPNLSTSIARLNELSRLDGTSNNYNTTHRLSMALVDAPLIKRPIVKSHQCSGGVDEDGRMNPKTRTVSSNDLRF